MTPLAPAGYVRTETRAGSLMVPVLFVRPLKRLDWDKIRYVWQNAEILLPYKDEGRGAFWKEKWGIVTLLGSRAAAQYQTMIGA